MANGFKKKNKNKTKPSTPLRAESHRWDHSSILSEPFPTSCPSPDLLVLLRPSTYGGDSKNSYAFRYVGLASPSNHLYSVPFALITISVSSSVFSWCFVSERGYHVCLFVFFFCHSGYHVCSSYEFRLIPDLLFVFVCFFRLITTWIRVNALSSFLCSIFLVPCLCWMTLNC